MEFSEGMPVAHVKYLFKLFCLKNPDHLKDGGALENTMPALDQTHPNN